MLTIIFWDNGVKGYIARSSIDRPPNDEEEIILMNKKEYPSLKPFQQMDFIDDQTDCEDDDKGCVGAIDGTNIWACIFGKDIEAYWTKKYTISQNVLAEVDHDMYLSTYTLDLK
ncbi:hypothetical protein M9H77_12805 [Catharanthus roseus]|uniref:Uncharacterized protein n=1 Tax=Catharanthus roseus TaxID=4058 RepID=A0ACC0BIG8_CATRO|nr:hypothetical protein M9H77_12805 [Catharanthus roseus]